MRRCGLLSHPGAPAEENGRSPKWEPAAGTYDEKALAQSSFFCAARSKSAQRPANITMPMMSAVAPWLSQP